jgi:uncharacterized protein (DUF2126 family)
MAAAVAVRPLVTLHVPKKVKSIISLAESIANAMNNNPSFPTPPVPIAALVADVAALNTAETAVLQRTKGAVEVRNAKLAVVRNDLEALRGYVQIVAAAGTPANAPAVMEAAGMTIRKVTTHNKPALAAKAGTVSGTIHLSAKAAGRTAAYDWQYSTDQKTWTTLPMTLQAKSGVTGLVSGTLYYFRVQVLVRTGAENWSQIVSLMAP